jgi:hypothetical protein
MRRGGARTCGSGSGCGSRARRRSARRAPTTEATRSHSRARVPRRAPPPAAGWRGPSRGAGVGGDEVDAAVGPRRAGSRLMVDRGEDAGGLAAGPGLVEAQGQPFGRLGEGGREPLPGPVAVGALVERAEALDRRLGVPVEVARIGSGERRELHSHRPRSTVEPVAGGLEHGDRLAIALRSPNGPGVDAALVVDRGELVEARGQRLRVPVGDRVRDRAMGDRGNQRAGDAAVELHHPRPRRARAQELDEVTEGADLDVERTARLDRHRAQRFRTRVTPSATPSIATSTR